MWVRIWMLMLAPAAWAQHGELQRGIEAHNQGDALGSITWFEAAVRVAPGFLPARLHLGSAYLRRVGQESSFEANMRVAGGALTQFQEALRRDPTNRLAVFQTACAFYFTGNLDEARGSFRRIIQRDSRDADALVSLGYMNLSAASRKAFPIQAVVGNALPLQDPAVRIALRLKWNATLDEAQQSLGAAVAINANDEDALGYLNLVVSRKVELAETLLEYQSLLTQANDWKQRAVAAKGKGTRAHGVSVRLQTTLPPPALAFVPPAP